eukprot:5397885-Lingulodinium_polyedra.AAC.1
MGRPAQVHHGLHRARHGERREERGHAQLLHQQGRGQRLGLRRGRGRDAGPGDHPNVAALQ